MPIQQNSHAFVCNLCKTGVIKVLDQIFNHLTSKTHKKKIFEYNLNQTSTNFDDTTCLTPDIIAHFKATCNVVPVIAVHADFNAMADNNFPTLPCAPPPPPPPPPSAPLAPVAPAASFVPSNLPPPQPSGRSRGRGHKNRTVPNAIPGQVTNSVNVVSEAPKPGVLPVNQPQIQSNTGLSWNRIAAPTEGTHFASTASSSSINKAAAAAPPVVPVVHATIKSSNQQDYAKIQSARRILKEARKDGKNHLQAVNEICVCMRWDVNFVPLSPLTQEFRYQLVINEKSIAFGEARSQQEAKREACFAALDTIHEMIDSCDPDLKEKLSQRTFMDIYGEITFKKVTKIRTEAAKMVGNVEMPAHFAAFLITRPNENARQGTIVALGTGNHIVPLNEEEINQQKGGVLLDMRALTVARRSFQLFLCSQVKKLLQSAYNFPDVNLFVEFDSCGFIRLKKGSHLHIFLSHAPDGDAIFGKNVQDVHIYQKRDIERDLSGCFDRLACMTDIQTGRGLLRAASCLSDMRLIYRAVANGKKNGGNVELMSLSDKLMLWCHVGVQGSLLSKYFREPILPYSIQVGLNYNHVHFSRALYGRIPTKTVVDLGDGPFDCDLNENLPAEFMIDSTKDAYLGSLTNKPTNYSRIVEQFSLNWFLNANEKVENSLSSASVEVIDIRTGKVARARSRRDEFSRLCKAAAIQRHYLLVFLSHKHFNNFSNSPRQLYFNQLIGSYGGASYLQLKKLSKDYQFAKEMFKNVLQNENLGVWIKHKRANEFCLNDFYIQ